MGSGFLRKSTGANGINGFSRKPTGSLSCYSKHIQTYPETSGNSREERNLGIPYSSSVLFSQPLYVCMYVRTYVCIYIYIFIYLYNMHIYIHSSRNKPRSPLRNIEYYYMTTWDLRRGWFQRGGVKTCHCKLCLGCNGAVCHVV